MKRCVGCLLAFSLVVLLSGGVWAQETLTVVSRPGVSVYGPLYSYAGPEHSDWGMPGDAVATWVITDPPWPLIEGATWISTAYLVEDHTVQSWRWFRDTIELPPNAYNISATLSMTADNSEEVYVAGVPVEGLPVGGNLDWAIVSTYDISQNLSTGSNDLDIIVWNGAAPPPGSSPYSNPTGVIYKVVVTYDLPIVVDLDIKPGSDPNSINLGSRGLVPVAILSSATFDANTVDTTTVSLAGAPVAVRGKGRNPMAHLEDVNDDGLPDLVCKVETENLDATQLQTGVAEIMGETYDGVVFRGADSVQLVPSEKH